MSKIKLLVEIDEEEYENVKNGYLPIRVFNACVYAIKNGKPLPKGHGRLIDADKLDTRERGNNSQRTMWWKIDCIVKHAPTIVEADKENDNEQDYESD